MSIDVIIPGLMAIIFLVIGIIFLCGKGDFLVAGYNTMDEEEKKKYDEKKMLKILGIAMLASSAAFVVSALAGFFKIPKLSFVSAALVTVIIVITVIVINVKTKKK